jgi:ATP phosphoribosyltransferase regulatory subunit
VYKVDSGTVNQFARRTVGMRDGYPDFAKRRRHLESELLRCFDELGFELVSSGIFEYVDTLLRARPATEAGDWVQLFDETGKAVALRPEMTPSIARMAAPILAAGKGPVKWCYAERVYRRTNDPASLSWASGKAAESTQVGVELLGDGGLQTDVEMIQSCQKAIARLHIEGAQIVVSHALFAPAFLLAAGVSEELVSELLERLTKGDYVGFRQLVRADGVTEDVLGTLGSCDPYRPLSLPAWCKELQVGTKAASHLRSSWQELTDFAQMLVNRGLRDDVTFDLTLHRDVSYYTGIVFEAFAKGVGAPIAFGGRYDDLLAQFGAPAPAIGYTFALERLLAAKTEASWLGSTWKGDESPC